MNIQFAVGEPSVLNANVECRSAHAASEEVITCVRDKALRRDPEEAF